jgi:hypothetical protein
MTSADVIVRRSDVELPKDRDNMRRFLWNNFENKREGQESITVQSKDRMATFKEYRQALVAKAKAQSLDDQSLDKCLEVVLVDSQGTAGGRTGLAYLPVGAYSAKQADRPAWVIVVGWEKLLDLPTGQPFGHVRVFAIDAKSLEIIGFCTCD